MEGTPITIAAVVPKDNKNTSSAPVGGSGANGPGSTITASGSGGERSKRQVSQFWNLFQEELVFTSSFVQKTSENENGDVQKCLGCAATSTPEWRRGPMGKDRY